MSIIITHLDKSVINDTIPESEDMFHVECETVTISPTARQMHEMSLKRKWILSKFLCFNIIYNKMNWAYLC